MSAFVLPLIAWATLAGLAVWSAASSTRALGDAQCARSHAAVQIAFLLAGQCLCAIAAAGPCGGLAMVACAWMAMGWGYTLALNTWPVRTQAWARPSGWAALGLALMGTTALMVS